MSLGQRRMATFVGCIVNMNILIFKNPKKFEKFCAQDSECAPCGNRFPPWPCLGRKRILQTLLQRSLRSGHLPIGMYNARIAPATPQMTPRRKMRMRATKIPNVTGCLSLFEQLAAAKSPSRHMKKASSGIRWSRRVWGYSGIVKAVDNGAPML